jgi:hypothetical protein
MNDLAPRSVHYTHYQSIFQSLDSAGQGSKFSSESYCRALSDSKVPVWTHYVAQVDVTRGSSRVLRSRCMARRKKHAEHMRHVVYKVQHRYVVPPLFPHHPPARAECHPSNLTGERNFLSLQCRPSRSVEGTSMIPDPSQRQIRFGGGDGSRFVTLTAGTVMFGARSFTSEPR